MAKSSNIKKLYNQVCKNGGFKELVSNILNNEIVLNHVNILIEDNPGYIDQVLDFLDDYEVSREDLDLLSGAVVKSLGKTKILHNNVEDLNSLLDNMGNVSGEDSSMHIIGDIFQVVKSSLPDMTDSDAGTCAVYIAMSLALREAFPEGLEYEVSEPEEELSDEVPKEEVHSESQLGGMDLRKFLKRVDDEEETSEITVAASESSTEQELGDEVIVGNGHKARKVKRTTKGGTSSVKVAASESTDESKSGSGEKKVLTEEELRKEFEDGVEEMRQEYGESLVNLFYSIFNLDEIVKELFEKSKTENILEDGYMKKFFSDKILSLSDSKKAKLVNSFTQVLTSTKDSHEEEELMKGIKVDDSSIDKMLEDDAPHLMMKCMGKPVLDALDGNLQDLHDLATAAKSGKTNIFYHTIANICEGDQEKACHLIESIKTSQVNGLRDIPYYTIRLAHSKNVKLAMC